MVKQTQQASPQVPEEAVTGHPLLRNASQVDELLARASARSEQKEFQIKEIERWKECVKALAVTDNGMLFLQCMIKFSGHNDPANIRDTMKMVESAVKSAFYLKWVRPFLTPDVRSTIEC